MGLAPNPQGPVKSIDFREFSENAPGAQSSFANCVWFTFVCTCALSTKVRVHKLL